ncbi:MAG: hypothetical protein ACYC0V_14365 [Armatimonadota bacterium]
MKGRGFIYNPNSQVHATVDAGVGADIIRPKPSPDAPISGMPRRAFPTGAVSRAKPGT